MPTEIGLSNELSGQNARQTWRAAARQHLAAAVGFCECSASSLDALVEGASLRSLSKDEHLIRSGDSFDMLALVLEGSLGFSQMRADGQRYLLGLQCVGDTIGYVPMVNGSAYPYDTFARGDGAQVCLIPGELFRQLRLRDPSVGRAIEMQLAYRMQAAYAKMNRDAGQTIEVRLAHTLVLWAQRYGKESADGVCIEERVSQEDLSDVLGASRQRVNFALRRLKLAGLVEMRYSQIRIRDVAQLLQFANDNTL